MENLINDYIKVISPIFYKIPDGSNYYAIETIFLDFDNDPITLYAKKNNTDRIVVDDNGYILSRFKEPRDIFKYVGAKEILNNSVQIRLDNGVLLIETTEEKFGRDLHYFIQRLVELNCLINYGKKNGK